MRRLGLHEVEYVGDVSVISKMSDSYYCLAKDLTIASMKSPEYIALPAGVIIIGVACIESYINELISMQHFHSDINQSNEIKNVLFKYGTAIEKKLTDLKKLAKYPNEIDDALISSLKDLIALRGRIIHFEVNEEKPNDKEYLSKLQKLEKYLTESEQYKEIGSLDRILSLQTANIVLAFMLCILKSIYKAGYGTPSPSWQAILTP